MSLIFGLFQRQISRVEKVLEPLWYLERPLILVWNHPIAARLKEGKQRKPDTRALGILLHQGSVVSKCVIVHEQARSNVEGNENVNGVVFVGGKDEENAKDVEHP